jgi:hypothetical protein
MRQNAVFTPPPAMRKLSDYQLPFRVWDIGVAAYLIASRAQVVQAANECDVHALAFGS